MVTRSSKKGLASESKSKPDWRSLHTELLESILDHLAPMEEDYHAFSEVCMGWRCAVLEKLQQLRSNHKRHCRQHERVPLLLLPSSGHERGKYWYLYDVMKRRQLLPTIEPWASEWRCDGSSHGWLILFHQNSRKVTLREPFSGREIRLPPFLREPSTNVATCLTITDRYNAGRRYALSIDPDPDLERDHRFVIMMTSGDRIGFFESGSRRWIYIEIEDRQGDVKDIVYCNGLFYVLKAWGLLYSISISIPISKISKVYYKVKTIIEPDNENAPPHRPLYWVFSYLVESPEGDLLRVVRPNRQIAFEVYKLVWFSRNPRWERVRSLGDVALFLGTCRSISVTASDFPGCQTSDGDGDGVEVEVEGCHSNSIYYTYRGNEALHVFNLNDTTPAPPDKHALTPLVWISPKSM